MSQKKLHIHSMPLVAFALVSTVISIVSVSNWRSSPWAAAVFHPVVRIEAADHGYVKVIPNNQPVDEQAGATVEGMPVAQNQDIVRAAQAAQLVSLQLSLENAVQ